MGDDGGRHPGDGGEDGCNLPNCVRSGQGGMVREQVLAINREEMVKYDAETEVELAG